MKTNIPFYCLIFGALFYQTSMKCHAALWSAQFQMPTKSNASQTAALSIADPLPSDEQHYWQGSSRSQELNKGCNSLDSPNPFSATSTESAQSNTHCSRVDFDMQPLALDCSVSQGVGSVLVPFHFLKLFFQSVVQVIYRLAPHWSISTMRRFAMKRTKVLLN